MAYTTFAASWTRLQQIFTLEKSYQSSVQTQINAVFSSGTWETLRYNTGMALQGLFNWLVTHGDTGLASINDSGYYMGVYYAWAESAQVDMASILNAMLAAKYDQIVTFIGYEQAYMAAIWNAPFNADYYAALARGWRKWP